LPVPHRSTRRSPPSTATFSSRSCMFHPPRPLHFDRGRPCIEPIIRRQVDRAMSVTDKGLPRKPCHAGLGKECQVKRAWRRAGHVCRT
jgi:hypothetical protein